MTANENRRPFLLEIGSEEIPARFIPTAMKELEKRLVTLLADQHLTHGALQILATPRRLTAQIDGLDLNQPDRETEVKGPPVKVAFDADGKPTKAGEGFARKVGMDLADCGRGTDQRGEHLLVRQTVIGRSASEVLAEHLPGLILGLPFRKTMRWGDLDVEYARPLQWILCLIDDAVVPFTVGVLESGRTTRGHRTLAADESRDLALAADYAGVMAELFVVPDPRERQRLIRAQIASVLPDGGAWREDAELLEEVTFLCEHPTAFLGVIETEFFELPEEVIAAALKVHQRYFTVACSDQSALLPHFLAVRDGGEDHLDSVRAGNERVLRARLADALFYWRFDQQKTPDQHVEALGQVTWLEGFGSVADQARRAAVLATALWEGGLGQGKAVPEALTRAAALSRFDLVTEMIKDGKEFTKLEGVIAARYAAAAGEDPAVCRILEQSLLPRSASGELPDDELACVLSVAWRLDTLVGCWLAGFAPTGAKDPYALRRHVLAMLRILVEQDARVDLHGLLRQALAPYTILHPEVDIEKAWQELVAFVRVRLEGWLVDVQGCDLAVTRAVLAVRGTDPTDAVAWVRALEQFRGREDFLLLARGFKRCTNILKGEILSQEQREKALDRWQDGGKGANGEDFAGLVEPAEVALRKVIAGSLAELLSAEKSENYVAVFKVLSAFGPTIDQFFDEVRVNAEDPELRRLRHGFLREIHALFLHFADFTLVVPDED